MAIRNPAELAAEIEKGKRLLGFDVGEKTIGLALSIKGTIPREPVLQRSAMSAPCR